MKDILEGIMNIIKSGFIVLGQKMAKIWPAKKHNDHNQHHQQH